MAFLRFAAVGMGGLHGWVAATRQSMNPDGVAYLDMGDAYWRGDWDTAINAVWSPLYSWVLGLATNVLNPGIRWEFAVVHLSNFVIFLFSLGCFELFWRQLWECYSEAGCGGERESRVGFPSWIWQALGYVLFIWSSLALIEIWAVTPDMLALGLTLLAATLFLRIQNNGSGPMVFVGFGLVLGLGYLAKAAMFPVAVVWLVVSWLRAGDRKGVAGRVALAAGSFLLVALPFILILSLNQGRWTIGEAGRLTYLRHVNHVPYPHWDPSVSGFGVPEHPARLLLQEPPVYGFAEPIGGTYPLSYDPSYWYEGVEARFGLRELLVSLASNLQAYFDLFFRQQGAALILIVLLYAVAGWRLQSWSENGASWGLLTVALAAFVLYALVLVETRYVGAFVFLFWAGALSLVRLPESTQAGRLLRISGALVLAVFVINLGAFNLQGLGALLNIPRAESPSSEEQVRGSGLPSDIAEGLREAGIEAGDRLGYIGYSFDAFWARLARVKIIAELYPWEAEGLWEPDGKLRSKVIDAFKSTGAKAVVTEYIPESRVPPDWSRVGETSHFVYLLDDLRQRQFDPP